MLKGLDAKRIADDAGIGADALNRIQSVILRDGMASKKYIIEKAELAKRCVDFVLSEARSNDLPSAEPERTKTGEWDMFELISSAWYGKQCYFMQDNGIAYSRISHKEMTVDDAIKEFIGEISDG